MTRFSGKAATFTGQRRTLPDGSATALTLMLDVDEISWKTAACSDCGMVPA